MATVAAVRDLASLRVGDAAQVDILYNPKTGEKIYDVLKVSGERPPPPAPLKPQPQKFSLQDVKVVVEGKTIVEQDGVWMVGGGIMIHLPGRGEFYLTLAPPPPDMPRFQPSGWADHEVLRFHAGSELVEITSKTNVLQSAEYGRVWIHQRPDPAGAEQLRQKLAEMRRVYTPKHPDILAVERQLALMEQAEKMAGNARGVEFHCTDDVVSLFRKHE
jgi:hypothetical protein